jgi:hypothetical protein
MKQESRRFERWECQRLILPLYKRALGYEAPLAPSLFWLSNVRHHAISPTPRQLNRLTPYETEELRPFSRATTSARPLRCAVRL